jgi:hypothetical protein
MELVKVVALEHVVAVVKAVVAVVAVVKAVMPVALSDQLKYSWPTEQQNPYHPLEWAIW